MISERRSDEAAICELLERQVAGWDGLLAASQNTTHRRLAEKLFGKLASRQNRPDAS
jgi:hypothetical protein